MKMKSIIVFIFICSAFGFTMEQNPISVEAFDEQRNNSSQLTLRLKVTNNTDDTLYNVHAKYFLNYERNRNLNVSTYYMVGATQSIDTIGDYLAVNIKIARLDPGVFPNSSGISLGMNYLDNGSFNKPENFSYPDANFFIETERITVYLDDVLYVGVEPGMLPDAEPISMVSGSELLLGPTRRVRFAWREVENAKSYRLTVLSAGDSSVLVQKETEKNRVDTALNEGTYLWRVESSEYALGNGVWNQIVDKTKSIWNHLTTFVSDLVVDETPSLVTPLAARKDTYLLDVKWGEMAIAREWDRPHFHHEQYDEEESYRCWIVAAQMLNHYYGGNITQDEIKLNFKYYPKIQPDFFADSALFGILGAFLHYNQGGSDPENLISNQMLPWVLNENAVLNRNDRSPTENEVKYWLSDSVPLYIWNEHHVEILDAYKKTLQGKLFVRVVNTDNNGDTAWISLDSAKIQGFMAPQVVGSVRMSDSLIHRDSDGDGVMDYDEFYRFGTDSTKFDSDGDGIDDKTEILSYTILEPISGDSSGIQKGITNLKYADIDMDGYRAECDIDSDNGGVSDGLEDLNKNGMQDGDESSPYDADDDFIMMDPVIDIPDSFTIYAMNELRVNDGVKCKQYDKIALNSSKELVCSIASESSNIGYAVYLGRSSMVNAIASKGAVFLRDHSWVNNPLKMYTLPDYCKEPEMQGSVRIRTIPKCNLRSRWPYKIAILPFAPNVGNIIKDVFYNESYVLKDGDVFKILRIHPGGKLLIEPGEMIVGDIQLESGSRVEFVEPGKRTILHANGSVIWRSWTLNDNLIQVAKGFMLVQHGSETMFVEGQWAGTIFAPNADLVLGQSYKKIYGRFLGNNVAVHQYSSVYNVNFSPVMASNFVYKME